ncbi:MAG: acyl-CoA dehydrogenase family protein [Burkholderiaceae bacterium]|nr:acyl-CoA dehydrogenase family protein [Burkholderiaceae bacterium]
MDLQLTPQQEKFRDEVRAFIDENLPADLRQRLRMGHHAHKEDIVDWHRALNRRGWAAPNWPKEYGGSDLGPLEKLILQNELYRAPAPQPLSFNTSMLGPVLLRFGSEAQKRHWMPLLANLDVWFCQGFSEPGSGSDLASLRTAAVVDGDDYVVNGQKTWTTSAHMADWIFCLVRTSKEARRQDGISMLLFDLRLPGVTIRPIVSIDGVHHFNEVFFDNVRVPRANLVGEEGRGWECTKFLLGNERTLIAGAGYCRERLDLASELLAQCVGGGAPGTGRHARLRDEIEVLYAQVRALEVTQLRLASNPGMPDATAATMASCMKIKGSELQQRILTLLTRITGPSSLELRPDTAQADGLPGNAFGPRYFYSRAATIYGGATEIQKELLVRSL